MNETQAPATSEFELIDGPALLQLASYFRALGEPTRLQILNLLRHRDCNVGELAAACNCSIANVSRHLSLLQQRGLVNRASRGTSAFYSISDPAIYGLCDLVCGQIAKQAEGLSLARAGLRPKAPDFP